MSLSEVVERGDTRRSLEALRDLLAETIDATRVEHCGSCECDCGPAAPRVKDVADLAGRLEDVLLRLDKLPAVERTSIADELKRRRAARLANASGQ
jgi:hypothetical protein